jgi:L-alanine-DL-glutamate epimerase-like enolase superfamily enzyme
MARLEVTPVRLVLREPLISAWGELREREILRVRLAWSGEDFGLGEAAPLEPYDGVSLGAVGAALDVYGELLRDADARAGQAELLAACAAERNLPQALAAIDLALWDRAGRRAGRPVALLLAADAAGSVAANATLGAEDRAGAAAQAAAAARAGFGCVKVKVGVGDDAGRLAAVRAAAGPGMAVRVDANGAWSTAHEAVANLRVLAGAGLEYAEEPVHGVDALAAVRAAGVVPVAMDETAAEPGAAGSGAADAVCLKIARCGGITGLLRDARAARAAGSEVYVASSFDGPHGVAAGVHAAAALAAGGSLPWCGLATLAAFEGMEDLLAPRAGAIAVPDGPGLLWSHDRHLDRWPSA